MLRDLRLILIISLLPIAAAFSGEAEVAALSLGVLHAKEARVALTAVAERGGHAGQAAADALRWIEEEPWEILGVSLYSEY